MIGKRPTGWQAVWLGLVATPVLLVATVMLVGVTAGAAGPSTTNATAQQSGGAVSQTTALGAGTQTLAQLMAYWTPQAMADATPMSKVVTTAPEKSPGSVEPLHAGGDLKVSRVNPDGSVSTWTEQQAGGPESLTEPYHTANPPFSRWQYFAKYLPNSPGGGTNIAASAQAKMFFTQGGTNFVCSASVAGPDAIWTAGHCVATGSGAFSTNVLFCPSYDTGVNATAGCWGAESLVTSAVWFNSGDLDYDVGGADVSDTGTVNNTLIGNFTGYLGFAYINVAEGTTESFNTHFISFGYPQASPFNGTKIHVCASALTYVDAATGGGQDSKSIGCDMTGGSSGGPWIIGLSRYPSQIGGIPYPGLANAIFGHNDWRHGGNPSELNSPPFNCLALVVWRVANDIAASPCP